MREKLIELVKQGYNKYFNPNWALDLFALIADHLIANGVTLESYDCHWATEQAYKNGYEDGKPKWIPVTERLPEKHGKYLVLTPGYLKGFNQYDAWLIYYHPQSGFYDSDPEWGDIPMDDVTHWMPLPEPPKGE